MIQVLIVLTYYRLIFKKKSNNDNYFLQMYIFKIYTHKQNNHKHACKKLEAQSEE